MYKKLDFYRIKAAGSHALGVIIIEGLDWWGRGSVKRNLCARFEWKHVWDTSRLSVHKTRLQRGKTRRLSSLFHQSPSEEDFNKSFPLPTQRSPTIVGSKKKRATTMMIIHRKAPWRKDRKKHLFSSRLFNDKQQFSRCRTIADCFQKPHNCRLC